MKAVAWFCVWRVTAGGVKIDIRKISSRVLYMRRTSVELPHAPSASKRFGATPSGTFHIEMRSPKVLCSISLNKSVLITSAAHSGVRRTSC